MILSCELLVQDDEASKDAADSNKPKDETAVKRGRTAAPQFKFAGVVDVNVRSLMKGQQELGASAELVI